jgi:hypothetical protein
MLPINAYTIRPAADADAAALSSLARLDSSRPLRGAILVAEADGVLVAALSLEDRRVVADPFRPSGIAAMLLRMRADALASVAATPLLRDRLRAAVRVARARGAEA